MKRNIILFTIGLADFFLAAFFGMVPLYLIWNHGVIYINPIYIHKLSLWHSFVIMMSPGVLKALMLDFSRFENGEV